MKNSGNANGNHSRNGLTGGAMGLQVPSNNPLDYNGTNGQSLTSLQQSQNSDSSNANTTMIPLLFLNPKGRILCDGMIQEEDTEDSTDSKADSQSETKDSESISLLLDIHKDVSQPLMKLLKQHRLRLPIELNDVTQDMGVVVDISSGSSDTNQDLQFLSSSPDPRTSLLGKRRIVRKRQIQKLPQLQQLIESSASASLESDEFYRNHRIQIGVPEGPTEIVPNKGLPSRLNLDFLNFINFQKGCYTGQELTIRTYHRGQVRTRIGVGTISGVTCGTLMKLIESGNVTDLYREGDEKKSTVASIITTSSVANSEESASDMSLLIALNTPESPMNSKEDSIEVFKKYEKLKIKHKGDLEVENVDDIVVNLKAPPYFYEGQDSD